MEKMLKTVFWTIIILAAVVVIGQVLIWLLPFLIVAVIAIYLYGKYRLKKFTKDTNYSKTYSSKTYTNQTVNNNDSDEEVVEVVDVDYKDVE